MKIIVETETVTIEIDLVARTLKASLPAIGELGEIRVDNADPTMIHLTLPFDSAGVQYGVVDSS